MKHVFVTGATGFIGTQLCLKLANEGYIVHALYRSIEKAQALNKPNIHLVKGNIFDKDQLAELMSPCEGLFHLSAYAKVWAKNRSLFYQTNVEGTRNIIEAAVSADIKRGIFVSSAGVLGPSINKPVTETTEHTMPYFTDYEATKAMADEMIMEVKSFEPIIVFPTRVYGPGLLSESNSTTAMIRDYINGKWHTIPGNGEAIGNYVFIDDVVDGMLQAYQKGMPHQNYILSGSNISYNDFFKLISSISGQKHSLIRVPALVIKAVASVMMMITKLTGKAPLITPGLVRKFLCNWNTNCAKALKDFNYRPKDISEGLKRTINWLNSTNQS